MNSTVADVGHAHRHAGMAGIGLLDRVHRKRAQARRPSSSVRGGAGADRRCSRWRTFILVAARRRRPWDRAGAGTDTSPSSPVKAVSETGGLRRARPFAVNQVVSVTGGAGAFDDPERIVIELLNGSNQTAGFVVRQTLLPGRSLEGELARVWFLAARSAPAGVSVFQKPLSIWINSLSRCRAW